MPVLCCCVAGAAAAGAAWGALSVEAALQGCVRLAPARVVDPGHPPAAGQEGQGAAGGCECVNVCVLSVCVSPQHRSNRGERVILTVCGVLHANLKGSVPVQYPCQQHTERRFVCMYVPRRCCFCRVVSPHLKCFAASAMLSGANICFRAPAEPSPLAAAGGAPLLDAGLATAGKPELDWTCCCCCWYWWCCCMP